MFKGYSSIQNHFLKDVDSYPLQTQYDPQVPWIVTEKIHGSNFSFVVSLVKDDAASIDDNNLQIQVAKRTEILADNDPSYYPKAVRSVRELYDEKMKLLFKNLALDLEKKRNVKLVSLSVFGELFGGNYPHKDVKNVGDRAPIQRHVYYCTDFDFYVFDIFVFTKSDDPNEKRLNYFLSYDDMVEQVKKTGLDCYARELFRGKLEECLNYDSVFDSVIPSTIYGLPDMPHHTNICEGIIIKPLIDMRTDKNDRMVIKKKNDNFMEKIGQKDKVRKERLVKQNTGKKFIDDKSEQAMSDVLSYMNENRLEGNISKLGDIFNFPKIRESCVYLLAQDTLKDYREENSEVWDQLPKEDRKAISGALPAIAKRFVEEYVSKNKQN
ncbi:mitochondrial RNA ligase [Naegleria gruberi]|uniref:Mitochondrial RNA ligase n=1 Tax=Naegleria gruberi TaxID=5762 RepID=D2VHE3_NAEGR|nr:mitochondrial RNA ligase [Naegleria gruberi]EFC43786.1 mitochondrial RNA ligase [Naegleria gruberi]|eukprot:XP_002676530.1 mitochondrial RNA ligase [Naegleria gruberi strain NEG-M]